MHKGANTMSEVMQNIVTRRSVRKYKPDMVVQVFRLFQKKKNSSHCEYERKI